MINRIVLIAIAALVLFAGCESHDTDSEKHLRSISVKYLTFNDGIRYYWHEEIPWGEYDSCLIEYNAGKVVKVTGGVADVPAGSNFTNLMFSANVYDAIDHYKNIVNVYTVPGHQYYVGDNPDNPVSYILSSEGKPVKITSRNGIVRFYEYSDNMITETNADGGVNRKFHFEDGNLVSVVWDFFSRTDGSLIGKAELFFEDYDTNPNPLRGMYYINGAFYRAFSENNFHSYTYNSYISSDGTTLTLVDTRTYSVSLEYNEEGYPVLGRYE